MTATARQLAGWPDLLALGEQVKAEVLGGQLYAMSPRPAPRHGHVQSALSGTLHPRFVDGELDGPGGWWIVIEPDVTLSRHDIVGPDLVGWRRATVPDFPAERPITTPPDWICEVLSPSTAARDRTQKADLYLRAGIGHYWMVDTDTCLVEVFAAADAQWIRLGAFTGSEPARIPPFEAAEVRVDRWFPPRPESGRQD